MQAKQAVKTQFSGFVSPRLCDIAVSSYIHCGTNTLLESSSLIRKSHRILQQTQQRPVREQHVLAQPQKTDIFCSRRSVTQMS